MPVYVLLMSAFLGVYIERITETHIQTLAALEDSYGVLLVQTFLDDDFKKHWTVGKDNCGLEIRLRRKGIIDCCNNDLFSDIIDPGTYDLVGRYQVSIGNRTFDTVRLVLIACDGQVTDFFIDSEGKEILHRFWVLDSWGYDDDIKLPYSIRWPHVEVMSLNGEKRVCTTYVIPEYVLNPKTYLK